MAKLIKGGLSALLLAGASLLNVDCSSQYPTCQPGYTVSPYLMRVKLENNKTVNWKQVYDSIESSHGDEVCVLSPSEVAYLKKFSRLSKEEQKERFQKAGLEKFDFIKGITTRSITFLGNYEAANSIKR